MKAKASYRKTLKPKLLEHLRDSSSEAEVKSLEVQIFCSLGRS